MKLPQDFINWVKANPKLVDVKPTSNPDLFVLKYKRKVFYDGLWNRFLEDCRGTIVDKDWNIVSLPFRKIYNYGIEKEAPVLSDNTIVRAFRKVNGFMLAVSAYKGKLLVSTTGSIDSDFVRMGNELLTQQFEPSQLESMLMWLEEGQCTMMYEACHKDDPHIVEEKEGLYPIGYRFHDLKCGMAHMFDQEYWDYDDDVFVTMAELKQMAKVCRHEGFVFYTEDGKSAKIKSPYYLTKKLFMRGRDMATLLERNAKAKIDEEYYPLLDYLSANRAEFDVLDEQGRRVFIEEYLKEHHA